MAQYIEELTKRTTLEELNIGDYIECEYYAPTTKVPGIFSNLGTTTAPLLPKIPGLTSSGKFNFLCVARNKEGLSCIADRSIHKGISYKALIGTGGLNYIEGVLHNFSGKQVIIQSMSQPSFYTSSGGHSENNEYHRHISNNRLLLKIAQGSNNIWNWLDVKTVGRNVRDTNLTTYTLLWGKTYLSKFFGVTLAAALDVCFRPSLYYKFNNVLWGGR